MTSIPMEFNGLEVESPAENRAVPALQSAAPLPAEQIAHHPAATASTGNIAELLTLAVSKGTPVAELKELVALHEKMEKRQAQKNYSDDMARFQAECPSIPKTSRAKFATRTGGEMSYTYAGIDQIAQIVNPILSKFGFSYRWDSKLQNNQLEVVCTVSHRDGHSEQSTMLLPTDSASAMSSQQKVGAAMTFAQRRTLSAALGITTTEDDTDAADDEVTTITGEQADKLFELIEEAKASLPDFLKWGGVEKLPQLPATKYEDAVRMLAKKMNRRTRA